MFETQNRFLIVAAHPDDEVLAMGGTLARAKAANISVTVLFVGEGVSARYTKDDFFSDEFIKSTDTRRTAADKALNFLNINDVIYGERFCCRFDSYDILEIIKDIENVIANVKPSHIFTHNPIEVNIDHRIIYRAVETAVRLLTNRSEKYLFF